MGGQRPKTSLHASNWPQMSGPFDEFRFFPLKTSFLIWVGGWVGGAGGGFQDLECHPRPPPPLPLPWPASRLGIS